MMKSMFRLILLVSVGMLSACSDESDLSSSIPDGTPVAYVDDTPITTTQVDHMTSKLGLNQATLIKQPDAKNKIRETLINSRAMALLSDASMDKKARHEVELAVAAYREELLVHRYLKDHVVPEPVGMELVEEYYRKHPEEFGGGLEKTFEMLRAPDGLEDEERNRLIRKISESSKAKNWKALANTMGDKVSYRQATARVDVLEEPVKSLVSSTSPGNVSPLSTAKGIVVVHVISEKKLPSKPIEQVSSEIRKRLAPIKLKEAIKKAAEDALTKVEVRRLD